MYTEIIHDKGEIDSLISVLAARAYAQFPEDYKPRELQDHIAVVQRDAEGDVAVVVRTDSGELVGGCTLAAHRRVHHCPGVCVIVLMSYCSPEYPMAGTALYREVLRWSRESLHDAVGWSHRVGVRKYTFNYREINRGHIQQRKGRGG